LEGINTHAKQKKVSGDVCYKPYLIGNPFLKNIFYDNSGFRYKIFVYASNLFPPYPNKISFVFHRFDANFTVNFATTEISRIVEFGEVSLIESKLQTLNISHVSNTYGNYLWYILQQNREFILTSYETKKQLISQIITTIKNEPTQPNLPQM
jgi:hypothetical protein